MERGTDGDSGGRKSGSQSAEEEIHRLFREEQRVQFQIVGRA